MILTVEEAQKLLTNLEPGTTIELEFLPGGKVEVINGHNGTVKLKGDVIREKYAHLMGKGITISQAAESYDVPRTSVEKWVYRSYISFVDQNAYPKLIDEADLALCAEIYKDRQLKGITGIPFFDGDGHIIEKLKRPGVSEYRRRKKQRK